MAVNEKTLVSGVDYYNIDNKNKRYKKHNMLTTDNCVIPVSLGIASDEALESILESSLGSMAFGQGQEEGALPQLNSQATAPTPLNSAQVKTAITQLFDNGEQARQRYKFKIRLNLFDGTNPEFIASLTKDFRNFKKHIPEQCREEIIDYAQQLRSKIKQQHNVFPYLGKLHLKTQQGQASQVEPNTLVGCWWDSEERGWSGVVMIQDWIWNFDLFTDYLTKRQREQGVKGQETYSNPQHQKKIRAKTWAEQRQNQGDQNV